MSTLRDFCVNMAANIVHDFLKPLAIWVACKILWPYRAVFYAPFIAGFEFCRRTHLRFYRACLELCRRVAQLIRRPEPLPVGTPSAIVMANQPPIQRAAMPMPAYVNNSMVMHWEAARQQEAALAAHFSTMPRFSAATLQGGNSPPGY
ncbi:MAG: hypothetical protein ACLP0B_17915 [Steroidobacteraceae bacterium]|jgi:hypothetical protein